MTIKDFVTVIRLAEFWKVIENCSGDTRLHASAENISRLDARKIQVCDNGIIVPDQVHSDFSYILSCASKRNAEVGQPAWGSRERPFTSSLPPNTRG